MLRAAHFTTARTTPAHVDGRGQVAALVAGPAGSVVRLGFLAADADYVEVRLERGPDAAPGPPPAGGRQFGVGLLLKVRLRPPACLVRRRALEGKQKSLSRQRLIPPSAACGFGERPSCRCKQQACAERSERGRCIPPARLRPVIRRHQPRPAHCHPMSRHLGARRPRRCVAATAPATGPSGRPGGAGPSGTRSVPGGLGWAGAGLGLGWGGRQEAVVDGAARVYVHGWRDGSPAQDSGRIRPGDVLVMVNGEEVSLAAAAVVWEVPAGLSEGPDRRGRVAGRLLYGYFPSHHLGSPGARSEYGRCRSMPVSER